MSERCAFCLCYPTHDRYWSFDTTSKHVRPVIILDGTRTVTVASNWLPGFYRGGATISR